MSNIRDQLLDIGRTLRDLDRRLGRTERIEKSAPVTARSLGLGLGARVTHNTAQSLANATFTSVQLNTSERDTDGFYDPAVPTRLTVPSGLGGEYLLSAQVEFAANATGRRELGIRVNGTTTVVSDIRAGLSVITRLMVHTQVRLNAGSYLEVRAFQDSGGALNINSNTTSPRLAIVRVG